MKKIIFSILALTLSVGLWAIDGVKYIDADGKEKTVNNVTEVTNSSDTLNAGWYVVTGKNVETEGLVCNGAVYLILADGAKLTAIGVDDQAGIQVSGEGNSLAIYGQTAQSGQLIANGGKYAAGIGSGKGQPGLNITINGGTITATGGEGASGIGGGWRAIGSNITINGGTVTATGWKYVSGIGGGQDGSGSNIKVAMNLLVKADNNTPPTTVITNTGQDLASSLEGKQYVTIIDVPGEGTKGNPLLIRDYMELLYFSQQVNNGNTGLCARLEADIDASGKTDWLPIGNQSKVYTGTFNGNGYKISKLQAIRENKPESDAIGLFGKLGSGAEVYGVGIVDGQFEGRVHVGAICGDFAGGSIHDCYVYNTYIKGYEFAIGGIIGSCYYGAVLRDCYIRPHAECDEKKVGIVCGHVYGKILDCYFISDSGKDSTIYEESKYTPAIIKVTRVSVADAKSGKLCNMLNHYGSNGSHWYQNLSTNADQYPVVNFKHGIVEWDGNKFINRSRDNVEITYSTSNNEPVTLRGGFGASELMGNYVTVSKEGKMSGTIVCDQPITAIDAYAFASDSMLKTITLPNSLGMIGNNAFSNCLSLANITLGENIIFIGVEAFKSCSALKNVYLYSVQPPQCGNNAFESGTAIHVIDASLYKQAEGWKDLNIVGDANMMKAYKAKKKSELVQAAGASKESDIPAEVRSKYNEYAASIDNATTVAAIEAVCVKGTAELQKMVQLPKWKDKGGIKINY